MRLLDLADCALGLGDILRLPANYDLGPGSAPVDLLVCELNEEGPALVVTSGHKAGLVFAVLPGAARASNGGLSVNWLVAHWNEWFRFTYLDAPLPPVDAQVLSWSARRLPEPI